MANVNPNQPYSRLDTDSMEGSGNDFPTKDCKRNMDEQINELTFFYFRSLTSFLMGKMEKIVNQYTRNESLRDNA